MIGLGECEVKGDNEAGRTQGFRMWRPSLGAGEAMNRKEGRMVNEAGKRYGLREERKQGRRGESVTGCQGAAVVLS